VSIDTPRTHDLRVRRKWLVRTVDRALKSRVSRHDGRIVVEKEREVARAALTPHRRSCAPRVPLALHHIRLANVWTMMMLCRIRAAAAGDFPPGPRHCGQLRCALLLLALRCASWRARCEYYDVRGCPSSVRLKPFLVVCIASLSFSSHTRTPIRPPPPPPPPHHARPRAQCAANYSRRVKRLAK